MVLRHLLCELMLYKNCNNSFTLFLLRHGSLDQVVPLRSVAQLLWLSVRLGETVVKVGRVIEFPCTPTMIPVDLEQQGRLARTTGSVFKRANF